jgi:hypothetical protein
MAKKPSKKEITKQLKWLKDNKKFIPPSSMFGDNNHRAIDAEIAVLSEKLDENDVQEKFDRREWIENQRVSAMDVIYWLDGEAESPEKNWKPLVKK